LLDCDVERVHFEEAGCGRARELRLQRGQARLRRGRVWHVDCVLEDHTSSLDEKRNGLEGHLERGCHVLAQLGLDPRRKVVDGATHLHTERYGHGDRRRQRRWCRWWSRGQCLLDSKTESNRCKGEEEQSQRPARPRWTTRGVTKDGSSNVGALDLVGRKKAVFLAKPFDAKGQRPLRIDELL
jgi:hypothetical protein